MIARTSWTTTFLAGALVAGVTLGGCERTASPPTASPTAATPASAPNLAGTSWQLVKFTGSDGKAVEPDDRSKYTLSFEADGGVVARIDCNRGHASWKSEAPNQLVLGPLALTRMMCPPGSMHDRVAADWGAVRSYAIRDGHLFLSLMADGGIYEYEPVPPAASPG
jgi:para-nitrobenzyl esterase